MDKRPVVILAGGLGTRLAEQTEVKPKPMVEIGGRPILWHIMKHFGHFGHDEFYVALGYRGETIKRYFLDYYSLNGSMTVDLRSGRVDAHERECEDWTVHLMETGPDTPTGGRVRRLRPWLSDGPFLTTYGDGVSDIDIDALLRFHESHGKIATISAVRPPARFGGIVFADGEAHEDARAHVGGSRIERFSEKPQTGEGWINGGFMVFEPAIFEYLQCDAMHLEADVLERLASDGELMAYRHEGFWQCMDTLRDMRLLEGLWQSGEAPWKVWDAPRRRSELRLAVGS